jgi:hypothetical protein
MGKLRFVIALETSWKNRKKGERIIIALLLVATGVSFAQKSETDRAALRADLEPALSFEASVSGNIARRLGGGPPGTIFADNKIVHGSHGSVRIERSQQSQ